MSSLISVVSIIPSPSLILTNNITIITILSVNYHRHITTYSTLCSINLFALNRNVVRLVHIPFSKIRIVDTLVSTIGLTPKQNGRRHISPLILHLG